MSCGVTRRVIAVGAAASTKGRRAALEERARERRGLSQGQQSGGSPDARARGSPAAWPLSHPGEARPLAPSGEGTNQPPSPLPQPGALGEKKQGASDGARRMGAGGGGGRQSPLPPLRALLGRPVSVWAEQEEQVCLLSLPAAARPGS